MRELKFRAFDTENKTWTFVTLGDLICGACTEKGDKPLSGAKQVWGQYTGLRDKNGKEIYEGDIVRYGRHIRGLVPPESHTEIVSWWSGEEEYYPCCTTSGFSLPFSEDGYEVIGNINENPELIEKEKQ